MRRAKIGGDRPKFTGLVLRREIGERIVFDGPVNYVDVLEIDRFNRVLIGINAPETTRIRRAEVAAREAAADSMDSHGKKEH